MLSNSNAMRELLAMRIREFMVMVFQRRKRPPARKCAAWRLDESTSPTARNGKCFLLVLVYTREAPAALTDTMTKKAKSICAARRILKILVYGVVRCSYAAIV